MWPAIGGNPVGIDFVGSPRDSIAAVLTHAEARGLILLSCGTSANVVRLLAPLTIPDAVLNEGLDILAAALRGAYGSDSKLAVA